MNCWETSESNKDGWQVDCFLVDEEFESIGDAERLSRLFRWKDELDFCCFVDGENVNSFPILLQTSAINTNGFSFSVAYSSIAGFRYLPFDIVLCVCVCVCIVRGEWIKEIKERWERCTCRYSIDH